MIDVMERRNFEIRSVLGKRAMKEETLLTREAMFEKAKNIGFSEHEIRQLKKRFNLTEEDGE